MLNETQSTDCETDDQLDTTPTLHRKFISTTYVAVVDNKSFNTTF